MPRDAVDWIGLLAIAGALQLKLVAKAGRHTPDVPAYEALLKARHHWRAYLPEAHARAKEYCEQAIALDPAYAAPHALLGFNYLLATTHSGRPMKLPENLLWRTSHSREPNRAEFQQPAGHPRYFGKITGNTLSVV